VAVEAMEGTDERSPGRRESRMEDLWSSLKVSKPGQDMRFDVPVVGLAGPSNG